MARSVTLASLRQQSRVKADQENSNFVSSTTNATTGSDDELDMINASIAKLWGLLVNADPDYYSSVYSFVTNSAQSDYPLPSDFYKLVGVDLIQGAGPGQKVSLQPYMNSERNNYIAQPLGVNSINLIYVPTPTKLVLGTDTFDGIAGWEEYVVLDVAIKRMSKEESETGDLKQERSDIESKIVAMAPDRDAGSPQRVSDVRALKNSGIYAGFQNLRYHLRGQNMQFVQWVDPGMRGVW